MSHFVVTCLEADPKQAIIEVRGDRYTQATRAVNLFLDAYMTGAVAFTTLSREVGGMYPNTRLCCWRYPSGGPEGTIYVRELTP